MNDDAPPGPAKAPVSVIVPVKNEAANIEACLAHLAWADEVFVVDSQSTDATAQIAERMGAKVAQFHFNGVFPKKKNWALESLPLRNAWALIVDADGYFINRRFYFMGRWIKHCGYYPSWNMRLFRRDKGRYERIECAEAQTGDNEVHEHVVLDGRAGYLKSDMLHFAYPSIGVWVEKHNRYSEWEAHAAGRLLERREEDRRIGRKLYLKRLLKRVYLRLPFRFVFRFFYAYGIRLGFLDGRPGFIFCALLAFYDFLGWAKGWELRFQRGGAASR